MQVRRNFEEIYRKESDPWNIGDAKAERYNLCLELVLKHAKRRGRILDIGCGMGAFLARFRDSFEHLIGVDVSPTAVSKGKEKYPFIEFSEGSADRLSESMPGEIRYDAIVFSDAIYYLDEKGRNRSLSWIADHLEKGGVALIAAWCPGGRYLEYDEFRRLVLKYFRIEHERLLESGHGLFVACQKKRLIAITVDYETWHPIPEGKEIDWEKTVFYPMERLLEIFDQEGLRLTLMAEMGEYFWLQENDPQTAKRMEAQWVEAVRRGHDVQLHLHPNWLPELGARCENGQWSWDWSKAKPDDYPRNLSELIGRCKKRLEAILTPVKAEYRVTSFRAGAYTAQPFRRLYEALQANGIICDSSVYAGGRSKERGYDYSLAYSNHQPYCMSPYDPQLKAPSGEADILEIPIFTYRPGERWFLDSGEGQKLADRLLRYLQDEARSFPTSEAYRRRKWLKRKLGLVYDYLKPWHRQLNKLLPKAMAHFITSYEPERLAGHQYFVMVGHTKAELHFDEIAANLRRLKEDGRFKFVTLSKMAVTARQDLSAATQRSLREEADWQVQRESSAVLGEARNEAQSFYLQAMIPLDRVEVLDLGCGAGYWTDRIGKLYPWMSATGVDWGKEFIAKAERRFGSKRVSFKVSDFSSLPFRDGFFDCIYVDNSLEHAYNIDGTLREMDRVLHPSGVLVAAIPSDARNPRRVCDNHTWKTAPHEVRMRLENAGFVNISIQEIDTLREFGMAPYPPSDDKMMYIRAWKRSQPATELERALEAMGWVYRRLSPEKSSTGNDPIRILSEGVAYCWGYVVVLGKLLQREGYRVQWATMLAKDHPRGKGEERVDSHEVLLVEADGKEVILDPMADTCIPYPLQEVLRVPDLAREKKDPDTRYRERGYHLYDTRAWYGRVFKYAIRSDVDRRILWWSKRLRKAVDLSRYLMDSSILVVKGAPKGPPLAGKTRVVSFEELKGWVWRGIFLHHLLRYQKGSLWTHRLRFLPMPFLSAVLLRLLCRGACALEDEQGLRQTVTFRYLANRLDRWIRDAWARRGMLGQISQEVGDLSRTQSIPRSAKVLDDSLPVAYLRTDLSFGVRSGGSVGHIAGVLNHLDHFAGTPIFLTSDEIPTVRKDLERHLILPDGNFWDFRELPSLHFNEIFEARAREILGDRRLSFVYQRYSLNNYAGLKLARRYRVPFVLEYNGSEIWIRQQWDKRPLKYETLSERIELLNLRGAELVVVVSRPMKDELVARGIEPERVLVNPNGVDPDRYAPELDGSQVRARYGLEGKTVVGFIGTFGQWHGAEVLAEAFGLLLKKFPSYRGHVRLLMIGDGARMPLVRANLETYRVGGACTLTGLLPQEQGPAHLAACDLLASSHIPNPDGTPFFGSPTKLFEYMAMGKGIVASDLDQIGEVLEHGRTAWLVRPGDAKDLAQGLKKLIDDPRLRNRLGREARQEAVAKHTWKEHTRRIVEKLKEHCG